MSGESWRAGRASHPTGGVAVVGPVDGQACAPFPGCSHDAVVVVVARHKKAVIFVAVSTAAVVSFD